MTLSPLHVMREKECQKDRESEREKDSVEVCRVSVILSMWVVGRLSGRICVIITSDL